MHRLKTHIPNLLALSRVPLAVAVAFFAVRDSWTAAFVFFSIALMTDLLDGYLAKKWDVASEFGRDVLEPNCDLALVIGAIIGLYLSDEISLLLILVLLVIPGGIAAVVNARGSRNGLGVKITNGFIPFHYVFAVSAIFIALADLAMEGKMAWLLLGLPAILYLVWDKRQRWWGAWLHGKPH